MRTAWLAVSTLLLAGCGTLPEGRGWGQDATISPGTQRLKQAAWQAARDTGTWLPAAGALLFTLNDYDRRASDWVLENTPLFGGSRDTGRRSDELRDYTGGALLLTALATPAGEGPNWAANKSRGLLVEAGAVGLTNVTTDLLKANVHRIAPNGKYDESFPSNHSTAPFARAALVRRNTDWLDIPDWLENGIDGSVYLAATGSAWARIEMGLHHPSDQLAGAALGNFIALFVHDAFLIGDEVQLGIGMVPQPHVSVFIRW